MEKSKGAMGVVNVGKLVPRAQLMRQMDRLAGKRMLYIHAPAGYGKTMAAHLWLARQAGRQALVTLDSYDNQLKAFCRRLCAALLLIQPDNEALREYIFHPAFDSAPDAYAAHAVSALEPAVRGALVLDNLHVITHPEVLKLLPLLLRRLPDGMPVLAASRTEPPACLSDMAVKGELAVIPAGQLRFSSEEIRQLFKNAGRPISIQRAEQLYTHTEGWAIGVNAILLSGGSEPHRLPQGHLEQFVKTQIWDHWDAKTQAFMVTTSVEEKLTPDLCAALTGEAGSKQLLDRLVQENVFISKNTEDEYHFHGLFRAFLLGQFREKPSQFRAEIYRRAGVWAFGKGDYYKAVDYFIKCRDRAGIEQCLLAMMIYNKQAHFSIEGMVAMVSNPLVVQVIDSNIMLVSVLAWVAFLEGRPEDACRHLDRVYQGMVGLGERNPELLPGLYLTRCFDFRISLRTLAEEIRQTPGSVDLYAAPGTVTQNMLTLHRSSRDFSEFAGDNMAPEVAQLKQAVGGLFGAEQDLFADCLLAGLHYERGELTEAHSYALSANARIREEYAPETKFCAMIMLAKVHRAMWDQRNADELLGRVGEMIERDRAFYLNHNLQAYTYRCRLDDGGVDTAQQWLENYGTDPFDNVTFYRLYSFFTTARAYITVGSYDRAIVVLKKILALCEAYRRPIDMIEAHILLAIAFWKRKRGHQQEAMDHLEQAVLLAHPYGYVQPFANEGAEVANMLYRLQNRAIRKNYVGNIPGSFVKKLHLQAMGSAKHNRGLTGGRSTEVRYTPQQKRVMALLCEGYSYRQIAEQLGIKFSTVRSHIELIYKKLDVPNETEAVLKIKEMGILDD